MQFLAPDEHGRPGEWGVLVAHASVVIPAAQADAARAFAQAVLRLGASDRRCTMRLLQPLNDPLTIEPTQVVGVWPAVSGAQPIQLIGHLDDAASAQVRRRLVAGTILGVVLARLEAATLGPPRLVVNVLAGAD